MGIDYSQGWWLAACGAFLMGLSKGGLPGVGNLTVALFALVYPARESVGLLLPVLLSADLVAVLVYRRHAEALLVLKLLLFALPGVVLGYLLMGVMTDEGLSRFIGGALLAMTGVHFLRQWRNRGRGKVYLPRSTGLAALIGGAAGASSMMANAAGPLGDFYFMALGLSKLSFIGNKAWFFLGLNLIKVPFQVDLGLIQTESLAVSASFMAFAMVGAMLGPWAVRFIRQDIFGALIWFFVVAAALRLLW